MRKMTFVWFLVFALLMGGCNTASNKSNETLNGNGNETSACSEEITVNNRTFSIEEINNGIRNVFNTVLYYHPNGYLHQLVSKHIEYNLYFSSRQETSLSLVYMIITNVEHPISSEQSPKLYRFGVRMTEYGLQSDFYEQSHITPQENWGTCPSEGTVYLGHYSMDINQITQPIHEQMSDQWKQRAEMAIHLYMNENNFSSEDGENLRAGKYNVYIQGFSESDVDSPIVFEHENGNVYQGFYYFVHDITEGQPADLNHVELIENVDAEFIDYLNKLKLNAAFQTVYKVE